MRVKLGMQLPGAQKEDKVEAGENQSKPSLSQTSNKATVGSAKGKGKDSSRRRDNVGGKDSMGKDQEYKRVVDTTKEMKTPARNSKGL